MAHIWKSMELAGLGVFGAWGAHRAIVWLHEPPVRVRSSATEGYLQPMSTAGRIPPSPGLLDRR